MQRLKTDKYVLCPGGIKPDVIIPFSDLKHFRQGMCGGTPSPYHSVDVQMLCGGTSGNTAYGLSVLGVKTMIAAKIGNDYPGRAIRTAMAEAGVDVEHVLFDDVHPTASILIIVDEDGERYLVPWPKLGGANDFLLPGDLPDSLLPRVGWVHFCGDILKIDPTGGTLCDFARRCHLAGITVSLDLNLRIESSGWNDAFAEKIRGVMEVSTVVFGSLKDEFPFFAPHPRDLVTQDRMVVARDGKNGCTLYTTDGEYSVGIYDLKVADTVGAGDCFNSGFIAAAVAGLPPEECLYWGNACGNYSVQFEGGHSCPDRETLLRFLQEKGVPH